MYNKSQDKGDNIKVELSLSVQIAGPNVLLCVIYGVG